MRWFYQFGVIVLLGTYALAGFGRVSPRTSEKPSAREEEWNKVADAEKQGLPKTALERVNPILERALKEKDYPEAIKALVKKIELESRTEGEFAGTAETIKRMRAAVATVPAEMRPVMHTILAHWWWSYAGPEDWDLHDRSVTLGPPDPDIRTWDRARIREQIGKSFADALSAEKELKATPIERYRFLLPAGSIPDKFRPTLYDFLAFEALGFYTSEEHAGPRPPGAYILSADSPIFGTVDEFLRWEPKTTDVHSNTVKAIKLYQQLLSFHKDDRDRSALLDVDLHRLRFGATRAVGAAKNARYKAALEAFIKVNANHELAAMAQFCLASAVFGEGDLVKARAIAALGRKAFPDSPGGKLCSNLIGFIEARSAVVTTERVWSDPPPRIAVTYKNVTKAYFRIVAADYIERMKGKAARPESVWAADAKPLLGEKPVLEFSHTLPGTADYRERTEFVPAPTNLKPGFYYLIVSHAEDFGDENSEVHFTGFWVSNLAIVTRQDDGKGEMAGLVTDNRTGEPIAGARVDAWSSITGGWKPGKSTTTGADGRFRVAVDVVGPKNATPWHAVVVTHNGQQLASANDKTVSVSARDEWTYERVVFFTDRALYRPGQPIHFKGIYIRYNPTKNTYEVVADRDLEVAFDDVNRQEIARQKVKTNGNGSFSGTFTAPRDRLPGEMSISVRGGADDPFGEVRVTVEEYKRPKFKVELEVPAEPAKLNEMVRVPGKAIQYNGVPVAGAGVRYRITRGVRFAAWSTSPWRWRVADDPDVEIAHGVATTGPDGGFVIPFLARPAPDVPERDGPSFEYTVTAAVTDGTGETRTTTRGVSVGDVALRARIACPEWLVGEKESAITIETRSLDGAGLSAKGRFEIYALKQPGRVVRPDIAAEDPFGVRAVENGDSVTYLDQADGWAPGDRVLGTDFVTNADGKAQFRVKLATGVYRATLETRDAFGKPVVTKQQFVVTDPTAKTFPVKLPNFVAAPKWVVEVGEEFVLLWGTGYGAGRAYIEVEHRGKIVRAFWTEKGATQQLLRVPVTEELRGGFTVHVAQVRENRAYLFSRRVDVPWSNKNLTVKWERFVSKLEPGAKETFTVVVSGPDAKKAAAEMVAAMYDSSLDAFLPHKWVERFNVFHRDFSYLTRGFDNTSNKLSRLQGFWPDPQQDVWLSYRGFPRDLRTWSGFDYFGVFAPLGLHGPDQFGHIHAPVRGFAAFGGAGFGGFGGGGFGGRAGAGDDDTPQRVAGFGGGFVGGNLGMGHGVPQNPSGPNLNTISARKNLNETAFFFPHLVSGADGTVRIQFTMPEALARWKFLAFAHDKNLRSGFLTDTVVTAKDLMVQPNPPRFLREGDVIEFPVKVSNQAATRQKGTARLSFRDSRTDKPIDAQLGLVNADQPFELAAGESKTLSWKITVPDDIGPVTYKAVAATDRLSDGEEAIIPVLSKRVLVMESLPLPIRGPATKDFDFTRLRKSGDSSTLRHQQLTVQMVSQPSWYAVMALPYLMEYPYECSEQSFNRLYANALARHIAASDPKIRRIFNQWKDTPALDSPLEKNPELKNVLLEETPWVREARAESAARKNVGTLFDENRLNDEIVRVTDKLVQMQTADGSWPWFPGGRGDDYLTLYITTGYGRLRHLGVKIDTDPAVTALARLDGWMHEQYLWAQKHQPEENHLSAIMAFYLYGRSFFLNDKPIANEHRAAIDYWLGQAKKHWLKLGDRQSQAHLALALKRFGDKETPSDIMKSLKERSKTDEELGMYWRDTELSFSWVRAPIETQAVMIEAFDEVMNDDKAVEECKVWLLKQKQTQDWKTTKATADAVYALLLRGDNLLKSDALVEVSLGNQKIVPEKVEAGTGFYEQKFLRAEVQPSMATIQVKKTDKGVSWGSVHWSYLEDITKVTPHDGTPLKLEKKLYKRVLTKSGPVIQPVKEGEALAVGDEVVVRIVLRTDRDMEYVHLKDHRGSGTEPVNVLSQYKFQDGLYYYESTKDTASHFFIDYLPKGVYVFEYPVRVQLKGKYPTGFAHIECMYAPEFNSHSENINLEVK
jgi:uncharacterized protein YfaS (alpha-2-macroglobulin family)